MAALAPLLIGVVVDMGATRDGDREDSVLEGAPLLLVPLDGTLVAGLEPAAPGRAIGRDGDVVDAVDLAPFEAAAAMSFADGPAARVALLPFEPTRTLLR